MRTMPKLIGLLCSLAWCAGASAGGFALIGDMPYSQAEVATSRAIIEQIGADAGISFIVHDGDIKSGGETCDDARLVARRDDFNASRHPIVLIPGDNEWTDCHRKSNGGYDPMERLAKLRELFMAGDESLGQRRMHITRQSRQHPQFAAYRENVRWEFENTLVVGLNMPGGNNNWKMPGEKGADNSEFEARLKANTAWIAEAFSLANARNMRGIMLVVQANPDFEGEEARRAQGRPGWRDGYAEFRNQLAAEAKTFRKPVVVVHGDTHTYQLNKPLKDANGEQVSNVTRVETFGSPFLGWVKVTVDATSPDVYRFDPRRFNGTFQQ